MTITYRVYREPGDRFLGIIAFRLDWPHEEDDALERARKLYGPGEYRVEIQGIDPGWGGDSWPTDATAGTEAYYRSIPASDWEV